MRDSRTGMNWHKNDVNRWAKSRKIKEKHRIQDSAVFNSEKNTYLRHGIDTIVSTARCNLSRLAK